MAEVTLEGVSKRFGATSAVSDLSLTVGDGAFVVLLGPTGAGKTTTLRLVAGLEQPDAGRSGSAAGTSRATPARATSPSSFSSFRSIRICRCSRTLPFPCALPQGGAATAHRQRVHEVARLLRISDKL